MAGDNEEKFTPPTESTAGLTKNDKLRFSGLVFLALLILVVGFWQLRRGIKGPFEIYLSQAASEVGTGFKPVPTSPDLMTATELRAKDTDKDGLNDYEELNIYRTSPYVADTDSDGFDDKTEVASNNDPNCPQGKNCSGAEVSKLPSASVTVTDPETEKLLQSLASGNIDPKTIREMLLQQGIDKKILDKLTDAEMLEMFKQAVEKVGAGVTTVGSLSPTITSIKDLENMSAADLRTLLKQRGLPEADLAKIKDADLLAAFKEALK